MAAGLAGCGKGNATGNTAGQAEQQAESTKEQKNQSQTEDTGKKDSVIVVMGPSSEPEAGFDPVYGWGAGEHVHEPLIQSTLTVTNKDLTIGYDLATDMKTSEDGMTWTDHSPGCEIYRRGSTDSRGCGIYLQYASG